MASKKPTKTYAEVETAYFAEIDKIDQELLNFTKQKEKETLEFKKHCEKKKLQVEKKFEADASECKDAPTPDDLFKEMIVPNTDLAGNYD